jgi:hypothetical protein
VPISQEMIDAILALDKPKIAEIIRVEWADDDIRYYSASAYDSLVPFTDVKQYLDDGNGGTASIEARLISSGFHSYEKSADLRTEEISLTFADSDDSIKTAFRTYGDGAKLDLIYYYPEVDLWFSDWFGSLMQPDSFGRGNVQCRASNGFKSREFTIGHRTKPQACPFVFGGKLSTTDYRGNGCPYNRQVGGSVGNLNGGVPFTSCDKSEGNCIARLGTHANGRAKYWGAFDTDVQPVQTDANGYLARTKGNTSQLKIPLRIIAGAKYVSGLEPLYYRKELNANDPERGFVAGVSIVSEGENQLVDEFYVNDKRIESAHLNIRTGTFGQSPTAYAPSIQGFSCTSVIMWRYGWTDAAVTELSSLSFRCRVHGYNKVRLYSDSDSYAEGWTNNRTWWLMEFYTNLRFGLGYLHSRFDIDAFIAAADWVDDYVRFTDNFGNAYDHYRAIFDAVVEPRTASELIIDICRAGRLSVPFQYDGKYTIQTLRPLTTEELATVRVFSDKGDNRNIVWTEGAQSITLSKINDKQLINHIELKYEDDEKLDRERPVTIQDEDQKLRAGKAYGNGDSSPHDVPKNYVAYGCRQREQVIKLGFALLNLGEFDEGGIENNLRIQFTTSFEQALGLKKFDVIQVDSDLLADEDFEYFRIMNMRKVSNKETNLVTITAQAYNHDYSTDLEVLASSLPVPPTPVPPTPAPTPVPIPNPLPCNPAFGAIVEDETNGLIPIPVEPC